MNCFCTCLGKGWLRDVREGGGERTVDIVWRPHACLHTYFIYLSLAVAKSVGNCYDSRLIITNDERVCTHTWIFRKMYGKFSVGEPLLRTLECAFLYAKIALSPSRTMHWWRYRFTIFNYSQLHSFISLSVRNDVAEAAFKLCLGNWSELPRRHSCISIYQIFVMPVRGGQSGGVRSSSCWLDMSLNQLIRLVDEKYI